VKASAIPAERAPEPSLRNAADVVPAAKTCWAGAPIKKTAAQAQRRIMEPLILDQLYLVSTIIEGFGASNPG